MSCLLAIQRGLEGRSYTIAAGRAADEKQQLGEAMVYVLRTGTQVESLIFGGSRPTEGCLFKS